MLLVILVITLRCCQISRQLAADDICSIFHTYETVAASYRKITDLPPMAGLCVSIAMVWLGCPISNYYFLYLYTLSRHRNSDKYAT